MSRRARAAVFLVLALLAAVLAATIADGYGSRIAEGYGPLRPVVVLSRPLRPGRPLGLEEIGAAMEVRRVPVRFVPPGTLASPRDALGLAPVSAVSPGSYLLAGQLRLPGRRDRVAPKLGDRRRPVEISVSGAGALLVAEGSRRATVDVVVTSEPTAAGPGRTYVAAAEVPLLALDPGPDGPGPGGASVATLGLTRPQALRLIAAESFARRLTLLPRS